MTSNFGTGIKVTPVDLVSEYMEHFEKHGMFVRQFVWYDIWFASNSLDLPTQRNMFVTLITYMCNVV